jgi:hypothetical protein
MIINNPLIVNKRMFSFTLSYELIFRATKLINILERKSTKFQHAKLFHSIKTGTDFVAC